jgi:hypothetical protein
MELTYRGSERFLPLETLYLQAYRRRSACRRTDAILLQLQNRIQWALNSAVECHPHTVEVVGSNPTAPTIFSWACRGIKPRELHPQLPHNHTQIYDAALNNFARLSMSAVLASPITK